jgi:hypothetical protein
MFSLNDLFSLSVEMDLSKYLPLQDNVGLTQIMEKINLTMLQTKTLSNIDIAIRGLKDAVPAIAFHYSTEEHFVSLSFFEKNKVELEIQKVRDIAKIRIGRPEKEEEKKKPLSGDALRNIETDFNFVLGRILGVMKVTDIPDVKIEVRFSKKEVKLPSAKLQDIHANVSSILAIPDATVSGFNVGFMDKAGVKHTLGMSQVDENVRFSDSFQMRPNGPISLSKIVENGLFLANSVLNKI